MRKIILLTAALSALMLTACDRTPGPETPGQKITFDAPGLSVLSTKAAIEGATFPTDQSFSVFGKSYTGDFTTWRSAQNYMYLPGMYPFKAVPVSFDAASGKWASDPAFYWPVNTKLAFIAYAPSVLNNENGDCEVAIGDFGVQVTNFDSGYQEDLLYCDPVTSTTNPVQIQFKHALSLVSVNARVTDDPTAEVFIHIISLFPTFNKGDFNQNLPTEVAQSQESVPSWTNLSGDSRVYAISSSPEDPLSVDNTTIHNQLVIPQDFENPDAYGAYISMNIRLIRNGITRDYSKFVFLSDVFADCTGFEMGKKYDINLVIDSNSLGQEPDIEITPTVTNWEVVESEDFYLDSGFTPIY